MKQIIILSIVCLYLNTPVFAQEQNAVHLSENRFNIGEKLSQNILEYIKTAKTREDKAVDLNGKLIVLDYWGHTCISCIRAFPHLDSLQTIFADNLQIILVNRESAATNSEFFRTRKRISQPGVAYITGDTLLNNIFPHTGVPYHVWIDRKGILRYTTDGFNLTEQNIRKVLQGGNFDGYNYQQLVRVPSLFDTTRRNFLQYFSYITKAVPDTRLRQANKPGSTQLMMDHSTINELYRTAIFGDSALRKSDEMPLLLFDDSLSSGEQKYLKGLFDYHLLIPDAFADAKYRIMYDDLKRTFGLEGSMEVRPYPCLTLVKISSENKLKTRGGEPVDNFYSLGERDIKNDSLRSLINKPYLRFSRVIKSIVEYEFHRPFIDSTKISGNVDITFSGNALDKRDFLMLQAELKKYNLELIETINPTLVLVLKRTTGFSLNTKR